MATFEAPLYEDAFLHMEGRRKTVYAVLAAGEYAHMCSGDRLEFGKFGSITIGMVRRYASLDELVEREGFQCLVPDAASAQAAVASVRAVDDWDDGVESDVGVLALRVRETHRK